MNQYSKFKKSFNFFKGKIVLVRVGVDVPIFKGKIENDFRLKTLLPTINFLQKQKAKIILIGHLGRDKKQNLNLIFQWFQKNASKNIFFDKNTFLDFNEKKIQVLEKKIFNLKNGEILLLDNIRATNFEKKNSKILAKKIFKLGSFYINEAFSVSHREHSSVSALPDLFSKEKKFLGFQFQEELKILEKIKKVKKNKRKIFILGGAKIATKIPMIENLMGNFDKIILGGAVMNNFYKKLGYEIGQSFYDKDFIFNKNFFNKFTKSDKFFLPKIIITQNGEKNIKDIKKTDKILDISPASFKEIENYLKKADFIFLNGPLGFYEKGHKQGTEFLLKIFNNNKNFFIAGGGNTSSLIFELKLEKNVNFISTGGGALISKLSK